MGYDASRSERGQRNTTSHQARERALRRGEKPWSRESASLRHASVVSRCGVSVTDAPSDVSDFVRRFCGQSLCVAIAKGRTESSLVMLTCDARGLRSVSPDSTETVRILRRLRQRPSGGLMYAVSVMRSFAVGVQGDVHQNERVKATVNALCLVLIDSARKSRFSI